MENRLFVYVSLNFGTFVFDLIISHHLPYLFIINHGSVYHNKSSHMRIIFLFCF